MTIQYACPRCRATLRKGTHKAGMDSWACPNHHGVAITLAEAWGHLQDDEIKAIWQAAKNGRPSGLKSPLRGTAMTRIEIPVDGDEEEGNRGPDAFQISSMSASTNSSSGSMQANWNECPMIFRIRG